MLRLGPRRAGPQRQGVPGCRRGGGLGPFPELCGEERQVRGQRGGGSKAEGTDQGDQRADGEVGDRLDEEEDQGQDRSHGGKLVQRQRADPRLHARGQPAAGEQPGDHQRKNNADPDEEQGEPVPKIEVLFEPEGAHGEEGQDAAHEHHQHGSAHHNVAQPEGPGQGLLAAAGRFTCSR